MYIEIEFLRLKMNCLCCSWQPSSGGHLPLDVEYLVCVCVCVCVWRGGGVGGKRERERKKNFQLEEGNQDQEINTSLLNISLRCSYYWGTAALTLEQRTCIHRHSSVLKLDVIFVCWLVSQPREVTAGVDAGKVGVARCSKFTKLPEKEPDVIVFSRSELVIKQRGRPQSENNYR